MNMRASNYKGIKGGLDLEGITMGSFYGNHEFSLRIPVNTGTLDQADALKVQVNCEAFHKGYDTVLYQDGKAVVSGKKD